MEMRKILSDNFKALMAKRPALDTFPKIIAASEGRLSNGKLDRIRRATHTTDIESLGELAKVYGLEPWQMLVESLNPEAPPVLANEALSSQLRQIASQEVQRILSGVTAHPQTDEPEHATKARPVQTNRGMLDQLGRLERDHGARSKAVRPPEKRAAGGDKRPPKAR